MLIFVFIPLLFSAFTTVSSSEHGMLHLLVAVGFSTLVSIEYLQQHRKQLFTQINQHRLADPDVIRKVISGKIVQLGGVNLVISVLFLITASMLMVIDGNVDFLSNPLNVILISYLARLALFFEIPPILVNTVGIFKWLQLQSSVQS